MNQDEESTKKQALATNEFSERDEMVMNFHLDVGMVGMKKVYEYDNEYHIGTKYQSEINDDEHARRVKLFLESTGAMTDFANQARNAVSGEPHKVLIVLDTKHSRKAVRYFQEETTAEERLNILKELKARDALVFLGDDTNSEGDTVAEAYAKAMKELEGNQLYRPSHD